VSTAADPPALHVIVLAAGASRRFGSPKQLVRIRGQALLRLAVEHAAQVAGQAVTVVLGAHAAEIAPLLKACSAAIVLNRAWAEGIASSIRAGLTSLPSSCDGVLLTLADQPAVTSEDLRRLVAAWRRDPRCIVAAQYAAILGVPAIFPRAQFPALLALRGDQGARALLNRGAAAVIGVPVPAAAVDIDRPEDLLDLPETS